VLIISLSGFVFLIDNLSHSSDLSYESYGSWLIDSLYYSIDWYLIILQNETWIWLRSWAFESSDADYCLRYLPSRRYFEPATGCVYVGSTFSGVLSYTHHIQSKCSFKHFYFSAIFSHFRSYCGSANEMFSDEMLSQEHKGSIRAIWVLV